MSMIDPGTAYIMSAENSAVIILLCVIQSTLPVQL
jgi:hypothetical protein